MENCFTEGIAYRDSTYELVSKVAYLLGVSKRIFDNEHEPAKLDVYERLEKDKNARIIRNLCIIRTSIIRNYKSIKDKIRMEYKSLLTVPEYIPAESIQQLTADGISFYRSSNTKLPQHIIEINRIISDRINNCKGLFPLWLNWQYIRECFVMPNGLTIEGVKAASELYYRDKSFYPYQVYMNWIPEDNGNIFFNDKKFAKLLYMWHGDYFNDWDKVSDAGSYVKGNIYDHIEASSKVVLVVDCENSDPYKLIATLRNLKREYTCKISSIILFDDVNTVNAWTILEKFTAIPVEHVLVERVKRNKSLVDIMLTARACREHYQNDVDSFIIVSSDSDYWGLITSLSEARFLVMIERDKCSPDMKNALIDSGIFYCYIDDFYTGNAEEIRHIALLKEMSDYLERSVTLNLKTILDEAVKATRLEMTSLERNQFYDKYIQSMKLTIDENGNVGFAFKQW